MTKREIIAALAGYADEQYVYVCLHGASEQRQQLIIQNVRAQTPWHTGGKPNLIALDVHVENAKIAKQES